MSVHSSLSLEMFKCKVVWVDVGGRYFRSEILSWAGSVVTQPEG